MLKSNTSCLHLSVEKGLQLKPATGKLREELYRALAQGRSLPLSEGPGQVVNPLELLLNSQLIVCVITVKHSGQHVHFGKIIRTYLLKQMLSLFAFALNFSGADIPLWLEGMDKAEHTVFLAF